MIALVSLLWGVMAQSGKLGFSLPCASSRVHTPLGCFSLHLFKKDFSWSCTSFYCFCLSAVFSSQLILVCFICRKSYLNSITAIILSGWGGKKIHQLLFCIVKNTEPPGLSGLSFSPSPLSHESLEIVSIGACEAGEWRILQGTGVSTSTDWTPVRMMSVQSSLCMVPEWAASGTCMNF